MFWWQIFAIENKTWLHYRCLDRHRTQEKMISENKKGSPTINAAQPMTYIYLFWLFLNDIVENAIFLIVLHLRILCKVLYLSVPFYLNISHSPLRITPSDLRKRIAYDTRSLYTENATVVAVDFLYKYNSMIYSIAYNEALTCVNVMNKPQCIKLI